MIKAIREEITERGQFSFAYCRRFCSLLIDTIIVIIKIRQIPSAKALGELVWWYRYMRESTAWYYELDDRLKAKGFNLIGNVALSRVASGNFYSAVLQIPTDYFRGMRILDVGCGPVPWALEFTDCEIYGVDPLIDMYRRLDFPVDEYSERYTVVSSRAEIMPFKDDFFDAIISVNVIDHVDDLPRVAREITRVLRSGGMFLFWVESHRPRLLEPWLVDDEIVNRHFGHLTIKRITEIPPSSGSKCYHVVK